MALDSVFLDAGIILDFLDARPHELEETTWIFQQAADVFLHISVSESVITNTLYVSKLRQAGAALIQLLRLASVLPNNADIISRALASSFTDKEDAILYYLAAHHRVEAFITRNKKHFTRHALHGTRVLTPKECVKQLIAK